jgi:hypothetical protein
MLTKRRPLLGNSWNYRRALRPMGNSSYGQAKPWAARSPILPRGAGRMFRIAPRVRSLFPGLDPGNRLLIFRNRFPSAILLSTVIATHQTQNCDKKPETSETGHGRNLIEIALDLSWRDGGIQPKLQRSCSTQIDFR